MYSEEEIYESKETADVEKGEVSFFDNALLEQNDEGNTPLHVAINMNKFAHLERTKMINWAGLVRFVVETHSREAIDGVIVLQNKMGMTILHDLCMLYRRLPCNKFLLMVINKLSTEALSKAITIKDREGMTVLRQVLATWNPELVTRLIDKVTPAALSEANVNVDPHGNTALHLAATAASPIFFLAFMNKMIPTTHVHEHISPNRKLLTSQCNNLLFSQNFHRSTVLTVLLCINGHYSRVIEDVRTRIFLLIDKIDEVNLDKGLELYHSHDDFLSTVDIVLDIMENNRSRKSSLFENMDLNSYIDMKWRMLKKLKGIVSRRKDKKRYSINGRIFSHKLAIMLDRISDLLHDELIRGVEMKEIGDSSTLVTSCIFESYAEYQNNPGQSTSDSEHGSSEEEEGEFNGEGYFGGL